MHPTGRGAARTLGDVTAALEALAPRRFAEDWDNVGLLVEARGAEEPLARVLLTVDLTEAVLEEALEKQVALVVAYHPLPFRGLKRLTRAEPGERVLLRAIATGVSVYSPHTALDAAPGGVNDWLARALGPGVTEPLQPARELRPGEQCKLVVFVPGEHVDRLREALSAEAGAGVIGHYTQCAFGVEGLGSFLGDATTRPAVGAPERLERAAEVRLEMVAPAIALPAAARVIARVHPYEEPAWDVLPLQAKPVLGTGMGRRVTLAEPASLATVVARVKEALGLGHLRVAAAARHREGELVRRAAVCAGAGGALFESVGHEVDLFLTGELRHHDTAARVARGQSVILCDHTNTERGYLPTLREELLRRTEGALTVFIAERDREPLEVV